MPRNLAILLLASSALLPACGGQNDDPEGAKELYAKVVTQGTGYRSWRRAPGFANRKPSFTAHASDVEIFVNQEMANALDKGPIYVPAIGSGDPAKSLWPQGSIVVKEGYRGDDLALVAIMEKRSDGWYWAEMDAEGEPLYSGRPDVCIQCHDNRASYSDWIYAFELPR